MFLAIKEMRYAKLRYGLIIGIMFLVAFVVFLLSGLATGLANEFSQGIVDWKADEIVLSEDANQSFAASQLKQDDLEQVTANEKAPIGIYNGAIKSTDQQLDVTVFGTSKEAFLLPKVTEGESFTADDQLIISQNLADKGFQVGDKVKIGKLDTELTIVGIFPKTYYTVAPVVYTNLDTWTHIKYNDTPFATDGDKPISAVVTKGGDTTIAADTSTDLSKMSIPDFIESIPGYSAQNLTLNAMIYFLFVIVAAIVGIFMYVITLQKTSIFGVMKAQGISNGFIARSIITQSFLVGAMGMAGALLVAIGISFVLPEAMPFMIDPVQWGVSGIILLVVAIIGGLFSIRSVTKVDPITAIGG